jgi:hypothetical protein
MDFKNQTHKSVDYLIEAYQIETYHNLMNVCLMLKSMELLLKATNFLVKDCKYF